MMTFVTDRPRECGIVVTDSSGVVQEFHEKALTPPGNLASAAVFILEPSVYSDRQPAGAVLDFSRDLLPAYVGRIGVYHNDRYHRDLGNVRAWLLAQAEWAGAIPMPLAADPWCRYADQLMADSPAALRGILRETAFDLGCHGLRELPNFDRKELPLLVPGPRGGSQLLHFFWHVPAAFSSRSFLENYGAPCFALAAG